MLENPGVFLLLISVLSAFLTNPANAEERYKLFGKAKSPYLQICTEVSCKKIKLPKPDDEDHSYSLKDLNDDGVPELIATPLYMTTANICSEIFILKNNSFKPVFPDNSICNISFKGNYTFKDNYIISRAKNGPSWDNEVYSLTSDGELIKILEDECIGCNQTKRTEYNPDGSVRDKRFVSDAKNYWERKVSFRIKDDKAFLYDSPYTDDAAKMYLIKGDVIILREFESGYYLAEYTTKNNKKIIKWIDEDAIDFEESK